jgi:hypothetical protein
MLGIRRSALGLPAFANMPASANMPAAVLLADVIAFTARVW